MCIRDSHSCIPYPRFSSNPTRNARTNQPLHQQILTHAPSFVAGFRVAGGGVWVTVPLFLSVSGYAARSFTSRRKGASTPGKVGPGQVARILSISVEDHLRCEQQEHGMAWFAGLREGKAGGLRG